MFHMVSVASYGTDVSGPIHSLTCILPSVPSHPDHQIDTAGPHIRSCRNTAAPAFGASEEAASLSHACMQEAWRHDGSAHVATLLSYEYERHCQIMQQINVSPYNCGFRLTSDSGPFIWNQFDGWLAFDIGMVSGVGSQCGFHSLIARTGHCRVLRRPETNSACEGGAEKRAARIRAQGPTAVHRVMLVLGQCVGDDGAGVRPSTAGSDCAKCGAGWYNPSR